MAKYINESGGLLVLADGHEIAPGAEVEITADGEKNAAVAQWIDEAKLVKAKDAKSDKSDK